MSPPSNGVHFVREAPVRKGKHSEGERPSESRRCSFSWNRDPATGGVIFVQSGPRRVGSTLASRILGSRDRNAGCGDYCQVRRAYFSLGKPIKEICRELHLSSKVVRKVIRSNATEFHYERSRQPPPRIGPWRQRLESLLEENKSEAARERLTVVRLYEELRPRL